MKCRALVFFALLLALLAAVGFSSANFNATKANPGNALSATTVGAAGGLTATPTGHDVSLSWTAGTNANAYNLRGGSASSAACSGVTYSLLASPSTTSSTDTARFTPQGTWYCYRVQSVYHSWTSLAADPVAAARIGVVATAVTMSNAVNTAGCTATNGAGWLDCGDRIVIDFNQPMTPSSGPQAGNTVCGQGTTIVLAATATAGGCTAGEANNLGRLVGVSGTNSPRFDATYTWSNANKTLTIDVRGRVAGSKNFDLNGGATWTYTPAPGLTSSAGAFGICTSNTGGGDCLPASTGTL